MRCNVLYCGGVMRCNVLYCGGVMRCNVLYCGAAPSPAFKNRRKHITWGHPSPRHAHTRTADGKGTGNSVKGTDNAVNGTDNAVNGTDNANKGTDNSVNGTDNANKGTDNESSPDRRCSQVAAHLHVRYATG